MPPGIEPSSKAPTRCPSTLPARQCNRLVMPVRSTAWAMSVPTMILEERNRTKKQHHDDAAGTNRSDTHEESANQSNHSHEGKRLHRRLASDEMVFNPFLEEKQSGNYDEQQPDRRLDEIVDASAMDVAQVHQKSDAEIRAGNAAGRERHNDFSTHRAFAQVDEAGGDLSEKVTQGIAADGHDGRYVQTKDEHGEQQYAAAQTR